ncbi:MAG: GNAT family N-acetyltransferase [Clostridium sp.]|uniref:GNAT family N-acetyltransferase n=1 Tax=Clostridium sp. TaxID=1506 RepID=UPI002FC76A40
MDIVKANLQDVPAIMDIISNCIITMESQGLYQWNEYYPDSNTIEEDIKGGHAHVIRDGDNYMAYVAINSLQSPEYSSVKWLTEGDNVLVVHRLSVHPSYQGMGLGKKMLKFIEDEGKNNNYQSIRLDTYSENTTSNKLYEKYGYQKTGEIFFEYKDLPFYCYEKTL